MDESSSATTTAAAAGTTKVANREEDDEDERWLANATDEDVERHVRRVRAIFEDLGISPVSTPSTSGRESPTVLEEVEDTIEFLPPPPRLDAAAADASQPQEHHQPHRRNSSLITAIVHQQNGRDDDDAPSAPVPKPQMRSTIFSKILERHARQDDPAVDEVAAGAGNAEAEAGETPEESTSDLVTPFLDSLYEAERNELAWMKPPQPLLQSGRSQTLAPADGEAGLPNAPMNLGSMAISTNSWVGSLTIDVGHEEGSPCMVSSTALSDASSCVLSIGTTTGAVITKELRDVSSPQGAPTTTCALPPQQPQEKNARITSIGMSFGSDNYVAVGYSTGAIAIFDTSDLGEAQDKAGEASQMLKVIRMQETKDVAITSLRFTYGRQEGGDRSEVKDQTSRSRSFRGTAKAAIGAMGMGRACTLLACAANGIVSSHNISVVAPAVSFLRRAPVLSLSTKIRGRLGSGILDSSVALFPGGVLAAIVMQNTVTVIQLPLTENQGEAQMITLGKVAKPGTVAFSAVPCVCWRKVASSREALFELLVGWDTTAQSVSVKPRPSQEEDQGQTFVDVVSEWELDKSVAALHWIDACSMLAVVSEQGEVVLSKCPKEAFHDGLRIAESLFLPESPMRQANINERSFHGSSAHVSSSEYYPTAPPSETSLQGQAALTIVSGSGRVHYLLLLSPVSRSIAMFWKNVTTPEVPLQSCLDMLEEESDPSHREGLKKQILVILDATMRKEIFDKNYDLAARITFSSCMRVARSEVKHNEVSLIDESAAVRGFLWQDAFAAFGENESSISAFTGALEVAIMKQVGSSAGNNFSGSEAMRVPPEVMQKLVESLASHPERIERCVIRIPIFCLDFNQVAKLCVMHNLHTAFAYLYNEGLRDALTPAVEMIRGILRCEKREAQINLMRKLCVYVAYCFRGMRYPPEDHSKTLDLGQSSLSKGVKENEDLTDLIQKEEQLHQVRAQLLKLLLLCPTGQLMLSGMQTPLLKSASLLEGPVLRVLLQVDSYLCLSTFLCAFEIWDAVSTDIFEASIQQQISGDGSAMGNGSHGGGHFPPHDETSTALQVAVDVLSREAEICEARGSEGIADAGCVWMFIAHQVATGRARFGSTTDAELLARVLEHLCLAASTLRELKRRESFEKAALRLVDEWWDLNCSTDHAERIKKLGSKTKLFLLCAKVHMLCGEYEKSVAFLLSYLEEADLSDLGARVGGTLSSIRENRSELAFKILNRLLTVEGNPGRARAREAVTSKLKDFTRIDSNRTARLIQGIQNENQSSRSSPPPNSAAQSRMDRAQENMALIEIYIEAICQIDPNSVLAYLQRNEGKYRLDAVLQIVMRPAGEVSTFRCDDAAVYLLERLGDIGGALGIILGVVREGLALISAALAKNGAKRADVHLTAEARATRECLKHAFELNFRNSQLLDAPEREELWFRILATFVNPAHNAALAAPAVTAKDLRRAEVLREVQGFLSTCVRDTITAMSAAMPLTRVAARLVQEHSGSTLRSFREILSDLLQSCGHEVDVLATARRVFDTQRQASRHQLVAMRRRRARRLRVGGAEEGGRAAMAGKSWCLPLGGVFSSSGASNGIHLRLAPPLGSELIAHGGGPNLCATTRVPGSFPARAKFSGSASP